MQQNHRHRRKRLSGTAIAAVLVCTALLYTGLLLGVQTIGNRLEQRDAVESIGSLEGRFTSEALTMQYGGRTWTYRERELTNLLLIGVDWEESENTVSGRYAGQADFLFLITIDRENKIVSTLQLDRDTMADIRVYGPLGDYTGIQKMQICLSHAYGKSDTQNCENTVWAVSRLLGGIPIDGYIALDMSGITAMNDALGGVTVTLEEDFPALDPEMTKGATLTLHGMQAGNLRSQPHGRWRRHQRQPYAAAAHVHPVSGRSAGSENERGHELRRNAVRRAGRAHDHEHRAWLADQQGL